MKWSEVIRKLSILVGRQVWHNNGKIYRVSDVRFLAPAVREIDPSDDVLIQTAPQSNAGFTMCSAEVERIEITNNSAVLTMRSGRQHVLEFD